MPADGSSRAVTHPAAAVGALAAGLVCMWGTAFLLARAGMSVRATLLFGEMALAVPCILLATTVGPAHDVLRILPIPSRTAVLSLLAGGLLWVASLGLISIQGLVWQPDPKELDVFVRLHAALRPRGLADGLYSILCVALVPAAAEELALRGLVLPAIASRFGAAHALWTSSLLFAAIHVDPYRFLFTLAVGFGLGVMRLRAGSLLPCVIAHGVINAATFGVVLATDTVKAAASTSSPGTLGASGPATGAALLALGVGAFVLAMRALAPRASEVELVAADPLTPPAGHA